MCAAFAWQPDKRMRQLDSLGPHYAPAAFCRRAHMPRHTVTDAARFLPRTYRRARGVATQGRLNSLTRRLNFRCVSKTSWPAAHGYGKACRCSPRPERTEPDSAVARRVWVAAAPTHTHIAAATVGGDEVQLPAPNTRCGGRGGLVDLVHPTRVTYVIFNAVGFTARSPKPRSA